MGGRTQGVKMKTQQVTDRANKYAFELILTNPLAVSVYYRLDVRKATSLLFPPPKSFRNRNNFLFKWSLSPSGLKTLSGKDNSPL